MSYTNPFQQVPSASKLHRIIACPASHKAEQVAPAIEEDTSEADEGHDVHAVLSDDLSPDEVSASAAQTAEMCHRDAEALLADWADPNQGTTLLMEERYAMIQVGDRYFVAPANTDLLGKVIFTGQFDQLYIQGTRGLLIDFKSLHGKHAAALENPQLMSLAVLVAKRHKLTSLRVALVQPWKGKPSTADYSANMLIEAENKLLEWLAREESALPEDRKAGDHCTYCKARFGCSTFQSANIQALEIIEPATIAGDAKHQASVIFARMAELSIPQLIHIQRNVRQMMGVFLASHAAVFKAKVEAGEVPGFTLKEKSGRRKISNVGTAYERAAQHGVTAEAFAAKCSLSLKGLNECLKDATKAKGKALENLADEVLHGITDTGKPSYEVVEINTLGGGAE